MTPRPTSSATGWIGLVAWTIIVTGLLVYLVLYFFPALPGCSLRAPGLFDTASGAAISVIAVLLVVLSGWWGLAAPTGRGRFRRLVGLGVVGLPAGVVLVLAMLALDHACLKGPGLTYVNRTTIPVAVVDRDSRSIVPACSERTLAWSGTWGGNHAPEPLPTPAYVVSAEFFRVAEAPPTITIVITKGRVGIESVGIPEPQDIACEGVPPPSAPPPSG